MTEVIKRIRVIDSHTAGEPTRVVTGGFPDLGGGSMAERREVFRTNFDDLRAGIVREPRGHEAIVGALLCAPSDPACDAGVIFFNNVGYLGMCGHGTIGLVRTLEHLGRTKPGKQRIETPVGIVETELDADGFVTISNVPSYRYRRSAEVNVDGFGTVTGDIAWGGNWFFLVEEHPFELELVNLKDLLAFTSKIRRALIEQGVTGADGGEIDHIELFSPSKTADSRNFVLCPGDEYDRSPCGTGTSAKLACLHADGKLGEGEVWRQESIIGSRFEGRVRVTENGVVPLIRGTAFVTGESELIFDPRDPFRYGF